MRASWRMVVMAGVLLWLGLRVWGQSSSIIVTGADVVQTAPVSVSGSLVSQAASVAPRIAVNYSNVIQPLPYNPLPGSLTTLLEQVAPHLSFNYAQTVRTLSLVRPAAPIPPPRFYPLYLPLALK